jgi:hypothetical protein
VHPGQAGVVTRAEELLDGNGFRIMVGDDLLGEVGDPV